MPNFPPACKLLAVKTMNSTSWQTVKNRARPVKQSLRAWLAVALLFALSACSGDDPASSNAPPPNIVIVMTDDQGWAQLGAHGERDPAHAKS